MCFAPQRRAIFGHRDFKKWPESVVFYAFWLTNVLRATAACNFVVFCAFWMTNVLCATAACNFSTSELQKVLRHRQFFSIFTSKCASRHSSVQFLDIGTSKIGPRLWCFVHFDFTCLLNRYLRTRRFSEATFRTSGTTNHWKTQSDSSASLTFRASVPAFYWLYTRVDLLSADLTSLLCLTPLLFFSTLCLTPLLCFSTLHIVGS